MAKEWRTEIGHFPLVTAIVVIILSSADLLVILFLYEKKREIGIDFQLTKERRVAKRKTTK